MATEQKVSKEQAEAALQQLVGGDESGPAQAELKLAEEEPSPAPESEPEPQREQAPEAEAPQEQDDVASLKKRLEDREAQDAEKEKLSNARWQAFEKRRMENEQILRDRYLRKASAADRAAVILRTVKQGTDVSVEQVEAALRDLEGTMNPQSTSYVAPQPRPEPVEDQALALNNFLNSKNMTNEEAQEFGEWVRRDGPTVLSPLEQAVAQESVGGFLQIAHTRWQEGMRQKEKEAKRNDAVEAAKSVQRTQKEAARAASASPTAPRKQPAAPGKEVDLKKLSKNDISELMRLATEQYL